MTLRRLRFEISIDDKAVEIAVERPSLDGPFRYSIGGSDVEREDFHTLIAMFALMSQVADG